MVESGLELEYAGKDKVGLGLALLLEKVLELLLAFDEADFGFLEVPGSTFVRGSGLKLSEFDIQYTLVGLRSFLSSEGLSLNGFLG